MFTTVILMIILVSSGVYMSLQLLCLIKSLAKKIDELTKEVKNISRSGSGTDNTKQPGGGTNDTKQPGGGTDYTKQPGGGTDDTKQPGGGTDDTKQPVGSTDDKNYPPPSHSKYPSSSEDSKKTITDISVPFQKKFKPSTADIFGVCTCGKGDHVASHLEINL